MTEETTKWAVILLDGLKHVDTGNAFRICWIDECRTR
jgi:hypothetical protein